MNININLYTDKHVIDDQQLNELAWMVRNDFSQGETTPKKYCVEFEGHLYFCHARSDADTLTIKVKDVAHLKLQFPTVPKETFISDLSKFKRLILSPRENIPTPSPVAYRPDVIELFGVTFVLSKEIQMGMAGERSSDHHISEELLRLCLKKKTKVLKRVAPEKEETFSFYFMVKANNSSRVLNLILKKHRGFNNFLVLTAYYPTHSILKHRLTMSDVQLADWKKRIAQVDSSAI